MTDKSRQAFESWVEDVPEWGSFIVGRRDSDGKYHSSHTQLMWDAWQASEQRILEVLESEDVIKATEKAVAICISDMSRELGGKSHASVSEFDRKAAKAAIEAIKQKVRGE